jgi:outer membrane protein
VRVPRYICALLIAAAGAYAPAHAADLMEIYREALEQDTLYSAARHANEAAQERLPQGRAGLLPTVTLGFVRRRQWIEVGNLSAAFPTIGGARPSEITIDNQSLTLTATQPIFRKENFAVYEQSKLQVAQADSQFIIAAQDLILRVAQAYFDILLAEVNLEVADAQLKAIRVQLEQAKRNFEVGTATIVDTHEAQARYDFIHSQEIAARNDLEIRKRSLQQIIGRIPDYLRRPSSGDPADLLTLKYPTMQEWITVAEQNNLALKVQQAVYEIAKQDVERAKAGHYPTVDLVAIYSDQKGVGGTITGRPVDLTSKEIGIQVSFPIFQGFATQSRVREALATQERVFQDLNNTRRNNLLQVSQQYLNVTNGLAQVKALKQALVSSQSQVDSTRLGQEVGVRTEVDVLNAQQLFYTARRDLAQARYNFLMSRLRLKAEAGELDEEDLREINNVLLR